MCSPFLLFVLDFDPHSHEQPSPQVYEILTTGKGQEVGLPGERHEHSSNRNAGQRAVVTPESKVDVLKWSRKAERCWIRQEESEQRLEERQDALEGVWGGGRS